MSLACSRPRWRLGTPLCFCRAVTGPRPPSHLQHCLAGSAWSDWELRFQDQFLFVRFLRSTDPDVWGHSCGRLCWLTQLQCVLCIHVAVCLPWAQTLSEVQRVYDETFSLFTVWLSLPEFPVLSLNYGDIGSTRWWFLYWTNSIFKWGKPLMKVIRSSKKDTTLSGTQ